MTVACSCILRCRLHPETRHSLDQIGDVRFVIAPNRFHHLFAAEYPRLYPEARLFGAPGLDSKRKVLRFDATLGDEPPSNWAGQIGQMVFCAFPPLNEVVFFHSSKRHAPVHGSAVQCHSIQLGLHANPAQAGRRIRNRRGAEDVSPVDQDAASEGAGGNQSNPGLGFRSSNRDAWRPVESGAKEKVQAA
jgi:hypothetical protein